MRVYENDDKIPRNLDNPFLSAGGRQTSHDGSQEELEMRIYGQENEWTGSPSSTATAAAAASTADAPPLSRSPDVWGAQYPITNFRGNVARERT